MNIVKYFFNRYIALIYAIISLLITVLLSYISDNVITYYIFFPVLLWFFIFRITDDVFDYEKDRGRKIQPLSLSMLWKLDIFTIISLISISVYMYSWRGILVACPIALVFLEKKFHIIQPFFMLIISVLYLWLEGAAADKKVIIYLSVSLVIPVLYKILKRKSYGS